MPRIFDNIEQSLLPALTDTLAVSERADFCVGYFNLRGWRHLDSAIDLWSGGPGHCCRLLVGMQRLPQEELREAFALRGEDGIDNQKALRLKKRLAAEFREQLALGTPTAADEAGLRRLARQIRTEKVIVKLFLRHPLHAKLYLLFRPDPVNPRVGFMGSSNLTLAGLSNQGELNIDTLDHDATAKLARWFEDRWSDRFCLDISAELAAIIEESWAREDLIPPYHIFLKMAYHLSQEARAGLSEFRIPRDFGNKLLPFQAAAVKIAAHHLNKRGGVLIGDVVGLGKTLTATALARIFEDDQGLETLIICPKNLIPMWQDYRDTYRLRAKVLSLTRVCQELPDLRRHRLVLIDESHNLRNREGRRYLAIRDYIQANDSKVILLSATPYNKTYLDLSSQLRLFVPEDTDLGVRPERLLRELGDIAFAARHQCKPTSLAAFEKSEYPEDWRDLMRLYLVRRTRSFIQENYAQTDPDAGRRFLTFEDGTRSYFPIRVPVTASFPVDESDPEDQYAKLFAEPVVETINTLSLPRYGLGNYLVPSHLEPPTNTEAAVIGDLSRAGKRLMGFCRTNLFKRLESSGWAFLLSVERHLLRNFVFLHAFENGLPVPIGSQDAVALDSREFDEDGENALFPTQTNGEEPEEGSTLGSGAMGLRSEDQFRRRAADVYALYAGDLHRRFKWLHPRFFAKTLAADLLSDTYGLMQILQSAGNWDSASDHKLATLVELVTRKCPSEKILVFSQYADTVRYLGGQLEARGVPAVAAVTGDSDDPTAIAWRFSPVSNEKRGVVSAGREVRVLIATDVLSEGQNLQDAAIVVNYDLPWAIIRLIQRVGRVDRIGQQADTIRSISFMPTEGVERIIRLRARVRQRLQQNAEVVGTDEVFFDDDDRKMLNDLYNERAGLLDGEGDDDVDLASYAYQIWKNAIDADPSLQKRVTELPDVVFSTKAHVEASQRPPGVLIYMRTGEGNDALAWVDESGATVTQSQLEILKAAACGAVTPALPRAANHHDLVRSGVETMVAEEATLGGQLGRPSGARYRAYERLKHYVERINGTLFDLPELHRAIDEIYRRPLRQAAADSLNRQLRAGIADEQLAALVMALYEEDRLTVPSDEPEEREPRIICSLGLHSEVGVE